MPNGAGAEELATAQFNAAKKEAATTTSESRGSFFRRRRPTHRRSKSLGRVRLHFFPLLFFLLFFMGSLVEKITSSSFAKVNLEKKERK